MSTEHNHHSITVELLRKYDVPGPRYTSYPTVPIWGDTVTSDVYETALGNASALTKEPVALYCHIPFCRSRCFYCGCNTCVTHDQDRVQRYLDALTHEIEFTADKLGDRNQASQLHFGGGTPTYIGVERLSKLVTDIKSHFAFSEMSEMSIEVDPRVTSPDNIASLREIGFNRISFGVQDFDPVVQKSIGRIQPKELVQGALDAARRAGYSGINFDLIYGLPNQNPESFARSISTALKMRPDRVALYSFAYLPKLRNNQKQIRAEDLPDTETKYRLFCDGMNAFLDAGYRQIGMDHFSLPEDELSLAQDDGRLSRNFMGYTVQSASEMIGFGMSSIGYVDHTFVQNISQLQEYEEAVTERSLAVYRGLKLNDDDLVRQFVITELMCNFTLSFEALEKRFGESYFDYFANENATLESFIEDGLLERTDERLQVTLLGRTFVRNIAMAFDAYLRDPKKAAVFSRTI